MILFFFFVVLKIVRDFVEALKTILFKYFIYLEKNDKISSVDEAKDWFETYAFSHNYIIVVESIFPIKLVIRIKCYRYKKKIKN